MVNTATQVTRWFFFFFISYELVILTFILLSLFSFHHKVKGTRLLYKLEVVYSCNLNLGKALHTKFQARNDSNYRFKDTSRGVSHACVCS